MKRSLQRHLSMVSAFVILLAGLRELQDGMLQQIAKLSMGRIIASDSQQTGSNNDGITDPETLVSIFHLPSNTTPAWLKRDLSPGLHTLNIGSVELRIYVSEAKDGRYIIVSQPTEVRNEIAINSALSTLIPLLLLIPVLIGFIVYIVRKELAPIMRLSRSLDEQAAERPQPIIDDGLPQEITPFVYAINRLLDRVNKLMSQQQRFIADAAHELRSPLTALSLQVQNLKSAESIEAVRLRVVPLQEGIARAHKLTEQLLSLARTQTKVKMKSEINVAALARELLAELLPLAEAKHIDLGIEEITSITLHADPEALRVLLKNALENAIKYAPKDGKVTLRLLAEMNSAIIEVIDNGPGIPLSERERVFDPFYRTHNTITEGSGLGLTIASEAANSLGGYLSLHETPGGGLIIRYRQAY
jgi:two-component system OmpR family sensor kinase